METYPLILGFACLAADLWFFLNLWPMLTCLLFPFGDTEKRSAKIILALGVAVFTVISGFFLKDYFVHWVNIKNPNDWYIYLPVGYVVIFGIAFLLALGAVDAARK